MRTAAAARPEAGTKRDKKGQTIASTIRASRPISPYHPLRASSVKGFPSAYLLLAKLLWSVPFIPVVLKPNASSLRYVPSSPRHMASLTSQARLLS